MFEETRKGKNWRLPGFTFEDSVFSFGLHLLEYSKQIPVQFENDLVNFERTIKELRVGRGNQLL